MPTMSFSFRQAQGQDDRIDPHVLAPMQAAMAVNCQVSTGALRKLPGWMRLTGLSPTGYATTFDGTTGQGISFPDHADYDLGLRWTIDAAYKPTNLSAQNPVYWRASATNDKITTLECKTDGTFLFTHRDTGGTETTLTSAHAATAGATSIVRVQRFKNELRMFVDSRQSAMRADLTSGVATAPSTTKFFLGVKTVTDGDTVTGVASAVGTIDEFRVFREEVRDGGLWTFSEYPWLTDPRLVLYARLNETSGGVTDYSKNGNTGTVLGSPTRNATALVTPVAPVLKLWFLRTSDGIEKWCAWSNGGLYAVDVI